MKNPKLKRLIHLNILTSTIPALLLALVFYTGWVTVVNLFVGATEGGYVTINNPIEQPNNSTLKIHLVYVGILEGLLSVLMFTCGINFFVFVEDKKLKILNELIDSVILNELTVEDLFLLRAYFYGHSQFKQQLKLVNSALEIKVLN